MIKVHQLSKSFDRKIIDNLNIDFDNNKTTVLLGPSGCGKTTLFNILSGIDREYFGRVEIEDSVGYIFQEDRLIPWLTVRENLKLVSKGKLSKERVDEVINTFHLDSKASNLCKGLSGGEKQRVSIGRAFLCDSNTILMDEALRSLDLSLKLKIIEEINKILLKIPKTMVIISHDIREALLLADRVIILNNTPMKVVKYIDITSPKELRNLYDDSLLAIEKDIYKLIL